MTCPQDRARLIVGSKNEFTLTLVDECGRPLSLTPYSAGNLVFCNCDGVRTVVSLTVPGANPDKGEIPVIITAVQAANMDEKWANADVELTQGADTVIIPLNDAFEIIFRNCPPVSP